MDKFYIGLDIGGTYVRVAVADYNSQMIRDIFKTPFKRFLTAQEEVENNICNLIKNITKKNKLNIKGIQAIGISLPALFDRKSGDITNWPNNKVWNGYSFKNHIIERFKVPVVMEDDANSAALGEMAYGSGKGYNNFAYITVSTGIGCGLIINNSIYVGTHGWAGEIGHIRIVENGVLCVCGQRGCLQSVASGPAILRRSKELANIEKKREKDLFDLTEVVRLARNGAKWAEDVFEEAACFLAQAISDIVIILDIPLVIIGGGVATNGDILFEPITKHVNLILKCLGRDVEIKSATLGDNSSLIGALNLAMTDKGCSKR